MTKKEEREYTVKGNLESLWEIFSAADMVLFARGLPSIGKELAQLGKKAVDDVAEEAIEKTVKKEAAEEMAESTAKKEVTDTAEDLSQKTVDKDDALEDSSVIKGGSNSNSSQTLDDILENAKPGKSTKGKTTQYVKSGSYEQTSNDFDALNPTNIKEINTKFGPGKTGTLSDGRTITARPGSSEGRPTLEIRNLNGRGIEIRYGE